MDKTREEIENLKRNWFSEPIWDLENTEGFEAHKEELLAYAISCEKEWEKKRVILNIKDIVEIKKEKINILNKEIYNLNRGIHLLLEVDKQNG